MKTLEKKYLTNILSMNPVRSNAVEKGTILTVIGFLGVGGGIYWYTVSGSMGILLIIILGFVCLFFSGDRI